MPGLARLLFPFFFFYLLLFRFFLNKISPAPISIQWPVPFPMNGRGLAIYLVFNLKFIADFQIVDQDSDRNVVVDFTAN